MAKDDADVMLPVGLRYEVGTVVIPGDRLGRVSQTIPIGSNSAMTDAHGSSPPVDLRAGPGTYARGGYLFASVAGVLDLKRKDALPTLDDMDSNTPAVWTVSVVPKRGYLASSEVIRQDQTVLARVVRVTTQQVVVDIVANQNGLLHNVAAGCIRREDVNARTQTSEPNDAVGAAALTRHFRPGDWIVARVISLGDERRYFVSTAEPALGVIQAVSAVSGKAMIPISWKEMECPETGTKETRKCARPQKVLASSTHPPVSQLSLMDVA